MTNICPEGHPSAADDYCDTCGSPMRAVAVAPPLPPQAAAAPAAQVELPENDGEAAGADAQVCPNCATRNAAANLFCEACGFDFTTGVMPRPLSLAEGSFLDLDTPGPGPETPLTAPAPPAAETGASDEPRHGADGADGAGSPGHEATSAPAPAGVSQAHDASPAPQAPSEPTDHDELTPPAAGQEGAAVQVGDTPSLASAQDVASHESSDPAAATPVAPIEAPASAPQRRERYVPPSREMAGDWVVEVWVDPDWYDVQSTSDPCPSPMVPDVVPLTSSSVLVGRPSASRQVRPDVDCGSDSGVSRRQAQLTSDGRRWWVEDLGSANGTYVGPASGPLPTEPLTPGRRVEVDADDRIYVGAWTRLVVRAATASERANQG